MDNKENERNGGCITRAVCCGLPTGPTTASPSSSSSSTSPTISLCLACLADVNMC